MTNNEIHALADKHCDAYIEQDGDCLGYEFSLTSLEKFARAVNAAPLAASLPAPDTHCYDSDTGKDVWSYSRELVESILAAPPAASEPVAITLGDPVSDLCGDEQYWLDRIHTHVPLPEGTKLYTALPALIEAARMALEVLAITLPKEHAPTLHHQMHLAARTALRAALEGSE